MTKQAARATMSRSVSRSLIGLAVAFVAAISCPAASRGQEPSLAGQMKSLIAILRATAFRPEWKLHPDEYAANGISQFFPTDPTAEYSCLESGCYAFGSIEAPFNLAIIHGPDGSLSANFILKETDPAKMNRADRYQITPLSYLGTACFSVAVANYLHKSKLYLDPDTLSKEVDSIFIEMETKNNTQDFQRGIIGGLKLSFPKYRVTLDLASEMPNVSCAILYDAEGGISELDSVANELAGPNAAR
ncbi:hypothetical protein [Bosea sp. 2RAB26]|uniref:hypothetical protein n=1 Tax=Bosea sp. 2RAB26 TaxID=3237476 RepID=UPI003F91937F